MPAISGYIPWQVGVSSLGHTAGTTAMASERVVLVGGSNITLSESIAAGRATISIHGQGGGGSAGTNTFGISTLGHTSGTSGVITGTALQFLIAGGNNVTLSQSINGGSATVTISAFNQSVQTQNRFDLTLDGNTSGVLAMVSSGTLILAGGNNVTLSQAGNAITISAANSSQSIQTQNCVDATLGGNTIGTLALISSGTITLAGGNNITLSQNGNGITISGPNTSSQSVQTQNCVDATLAGNTAGTLALISSGTMTLAGGNNITLSQNGNGVTISAFTQSVQTQMTGLSAGISTQGNTAGTTGVVSNQLLLVGGNNVTLSQSVNGASATLTIFGPNTSSQTVQTQNCVDLSFAGNTSGTLTLISSGTAIFAGGNNITLSQNGQNITISGANTSSQSVQTQNLFDLTLAGNTTGTLALVSSGTLTLAGGNNLTLSQNGNGVTLSAVPTGTDNLYVQQVGTVNSAGNASLLSYALIDHVHAGIYAAGVSTAGNTSGDTAVQAGQLVLVGGNNVTLSQSNNVANGMTVTISVANSAAQTVQTQNCVDLSLSGNTSGTLTLISSGTAILAGGNNITLSQNGQSITISAANSASQTVQTQNCLDASLAGNTAGTLALMSSGTMIIAGGNNITLSQNGQSWTISGPNTAAQSVQTQNCVDVSLAGNTSGTLTLISSGTAILAGGNNVTLSQNGQSITISAFNQTVQTQNCVDLTLGGNTTGTLTLISSGTAFLAGGNNVTLSQNGQSVTISVANFLTTAAQSSAMLSYFENLPVIDPGSTTLSAGISNLQVVPFTMPHAISIGFLRVPVSMSYVSTEVSGTTANSTWSVNRSYTFAAAIMTQGVGASSLSLQYLTSSQATWIFQNQIQAAAQGSRYTVTQNVSYPISGTTSNYTTSYPQSSANVQLSSASLTLFTGPRFMDIPLAISLSAGNYWLVLGQSTNSATQAGNAALGGASAGFSFIGMSQNNLTFGYPGAVTNSSIQMQPGLGSFSTNAALMSTSSIALANISIQSSFPRANFQMIRYA